ncbi:MAG: hypothetical protein QW567_04000 [Candidatus Hadarchaeales archaeon]
MEAPAQAAPAKVQALSEAKLTLFFALTGMVTGALSSAISLTLGTGMGTLCLLLAIFLFYASYKLASNEKFRNRYLMAMLEQSEVKKNIRIWMTGFWPFFIMWLIAWVMIYSSVVTFF